MAGFTRALKRGWLGPEFVPVVDRAWSAVLTYRTRSATGDQWLQQAILEPLMISLAMVVGHELRNRMPQGCVPEEDHPTQIFFFNGTHKSFRERVQIR